MRTTDDPGTFLIKCPGCKSYHAVYTRDHTGQHPKWDFNGDFSKPTFSPSLLVNFDRWDPPVTSENLAQWQKKPWHQKKVEYTCHSFIRDGVWQFLDDCTHELAGKHVPMIDLDDEVNGG